MSDGPEIWFYHLERSSLDQVLPGLLEKTLERGWRAVVRVSDPAELERLDAHLWTWRDDAFLAHGLADEPHAERQPIVLSGNQTNPNAAQAVFVLDSSQIGSLDGVERCFIVFDGRDDDSLNAARERWRALKTASANLAYWKQTPEGRWEKAA